MLHISRDFITLPAVYLPAASMYFTAIFLRTVLNYSIVGHTNFAIDGSGYLAGNGTNGSISSANDYQNRFTPDGYTVSSSDINRILVIRSINNPMQTSGLWRVIGVDTIANQFILNLRGEPPAIESGLTWRLFLAENVVSFTNGANSNTGQYRGRTSAATTSRIIMQSPHSTAFQVRLTYETANDYNSTLIVRQKFTIAPGYGGDSIGDFPVGGQHLHTALWKNTSVNNSGAGTLIGFNARDAYAMARYYFWGDDSTGTVVLISRSVDVANTECFASFGIPEDEESPNDSVPLRRVFAFGNGNIFSGAYGIINFISGPIQVFTNGGGTWGYSGQPIFCGISTYCLLSGQAIQNTGIRYDSVASDNPYLGMTELQTVDLVAGTWDEADVIGEQPVLFLEPRRMGRFPIARLGRANYGDWTTATDGNRSWFHAQNGVFLPWYGAILP